MGEPFSGTPLSKRASEDRLDSWKEITAYLGRDVTTVQRWEKREGMPVHRHVHDKRGSVYALGPELDAWLQGTEQARADAFAKLENQLLVARREYEGVKQLDEALFGNELDAA